MSQILQGDALAVLKTLPDESVQCCVTSPPYYALRDYGIPGQIGMEETPEVYVATLVKVFSEVRRVLRSDGVCWINIGDSYSNESKWGGQTSGLHVNAIKDTFPRARRYTGLGAKNLIGIPWRVALALQSDGWILRSDCIWSKPNTMPESVDDRPTKSHEYVFLLARSEEYFYDSEAVKEPASANTHSRGSGIHPKSAEPGSGIRSNSSFEASVRQVVATRNKRTVWTIPSQPYSEAHFATMPPKLVEPCILAGTSPRACEHCTSPWERILSPASGGSIGKAWNDHQGDWQLGNRANKLAKGRDSYTPGQTIGWQPTCSCADNTGAGKCVVLDPFLGAGTVALVALQHGRDYLGIELNPSYIELAERRIATIQPHLWSAGHLPA